MEKIDIQPVVSGDEGAISRLVTEVFNEFIAPGYCEEGIARFMDFGTPEKIAQRLTSPGCIFIKALCNSTIVGYAGIRDKSHISQFFVLRDYQGKGIGRQLFNDLLKRALKSFPEITQLTVNSSPYAVPVYTKLGFSQTEEQKEENGMIFTPMCYEIKQ